MNSLVSTNMYTLLKKVFFLLFLITTLSCNKDKASMSGARRLQLPIIADGYRVIPRPVSETVEVPGSLLPDEETQIRAEVNGRVVMLDIQEGAVVPKDKLLVKLFDRDLQAELNKLRVQLQIAEKSEERQRELLKISGISQQDYDLTALNVDNLKADIQSLQIAVSKTEIRAPYKGKLGLRYVSLGSYISPTDMITSISQVEQLKLEFAVPEKYAKNISRGYKVKFRVDGGSAYHEATIIATENSVDAATRTLRVRATVDKIHPELVPGIFARVAVQLGRNENALMVPTQAIMPQSRNKQVIVLRGDSVQFKVVETGIRDSVYVQITEGINPGDTLIISGLMAIRPNSRIKIGEIHQHKRQEEL